MTESPHERVDDSRHFTMIYTPVTTPDGKTVSLIDVWIDGKYDGPDIWVPPDTPEQADAN